MDPSGAPAGFAEVALFRGAVGPYAKEIEAHSGGYAAFAHLEGWYVKPAYRGHGFGRKLVERVEAWCRSRSVRVLASDTTPLHPDGCDAHVRAGFTKIHEITIFMKSL
jgi:GNAT superfamily N-acetyltransferase